MNICSVTVLDNSFGCPTEYRLECKLIYSKDQKEFWDAPMQITLFGTPYYKKSWDEETIFYSSVR